MSSSVSSKCTNTQLQIECLFATPDRKASPSSTYSHRCLQLQSLSNCTDSRGAVLWNCLSQLNELSFHSDLVLHLRAGKWASSNPYTSLCGYSASLLEKCFILGSQTKKRPCISFSANAQWHTECGEEEKKMGGGQLIRWMNENSSKWFTKDKYFSTCLVTTPLRL